MAAPMICSVSSSCFMRERLNLGFHGYKEGFTSSFFIRVIRGHFPFWVIALAIRIVIAPDSRDNLVA